MKINTKNNLKKLLISVVAVIAVNFIGNFFFHRFDLTKDNRYTLSETSLNIINKVNEPLYIDVYLDGEFPAEFKRLQTETRQLLEEFQAYNSNIIIQFVNPLENKEDNMNKAKELFGKGLTPINITVDDKGKQSQSMVFPWAIATYKGREVNIPLLKNMMGVSTEEKVVSSIQHLEYSFADAFNKITTKKQKKVAVIKGNGELHDLLMAKFLLQVRESYHIGPFTLDSVSKDPNKTLEALKKYDLAIIAKPTQRFSDEEKQVLDQFIMNGGKTLWLIDQVNMEMDSLYSETGSALAFPNDLNLNDMFFKYGFRITPDLVKDELGTPLKLATGEPGTSTQFQEFNWKYAPFIFPESEHPIVKNMGGLRFDFANSIDTLKNKIKKTILLKSSPNSKRVGAPVEVKLNMVVEKTTPDDYKNTGEIPVSVLLEGQFQSLYENRVLPFEEKGYESKGKNNKMIVISDGDIVKNQLDKNFQPVELGYDTKTGNMFDNKDFMMNCVNYLLDDSGIINIRSKEVDLPLLDKEKVHDNYTFYQIVTIVLPLLLLAIFGVLFVLWRKKKYTK